jgi:hypothetical protein
MYRGTDILNEFLFKHMMVGGRQCIVLMHERGLVPRGDKFGDLIVQLGETQVERPDGLTFLVGNIIVFP